VLSTVEAGRLLLKASTTSWHKPLLDTLEIVAAPEPAARVQALLSDRIDIAFQLGPDDLSAVEGAGMRMSVQPEPAVIVLEFINTKPSPLRDLRVRQALNYAVNKDEIVATILAGRALPASQPAPSIAFGYDPTLKPYPYDPARAKALLAEAGYPNGFKFIAEAFGGNSTYSLLVYEKVAADLAKVGVTMDMQVIPAPKYARGIYQGEWDGTAVGIDYSSTPSLDALRGFRRHSCLWVKPWYCDRSLMPLLNEALGTFDLDRRRELTHQVIRHQRDQASGIFLHEQPRFDGLNPRVKNYAIKVGYIAYDSIDIEEK
jgi:peptide/nickel transport system substrate-binding protein